MSYRVGTPNYNLPQTEGTDKRDWSDTNQAFLAIDTAIKNAVTAAASAGSAASAAQAAADDAASAASHAQTDATAAQTLATTASEQASLARTAANTAQTTAQQAQTAASAAQTAAQQAVSNVGNLANLNTTNKSNTVAAINEVNSALTDVETDLSNMFSINPSSSEVNVGTGTESSPVTYTAPSDGMLTYYWNGASAGTGANTSVTVSLNGHIVVIGALSGCFPVRKNDVIVLKGTNASGLQGRFNAFK